MPRIGNSTWLIFGAPIVMFKNKNKNKNRNKNILLPKMERLKQMQKYHTTYHSQYPKMISIKELGLDMSVLFGIVSLFVRVKIESTTSSLPHRGLFNLYFTAYINIFCYIYIIFSTKFTGLSPNLSTSTFYSTPQTVARLIFT